MPEEGKRGAGQNHRLMSPKAALSVANSVLGAILGTAALVFIAKDMGPEVLGILGYAMVSIGILSFLSDFGMGSVHAMQISRGEDLGRCIGAYAAIRVTLLAMFAVVTLVLIEIWKDGFFSGTMPSNNVSVGPLVDAMYVFLVYYVLMGLSQIATHTYDALGAVAKVHVPAILEIVVRVSFIIYIAATPLGAGPDGPALLASAYAAGIIASTLLVSLLMRKYMIVKPNREILMKYIRALTPVFVVSMILVLDLFVDKAIVGYFWGERELGLYFGVQRMAVFVSVFSLSVATLILPSVTTYFSRRDVAASWDIVNQAERYVSLIVIPTAAFYLTYGREILTVFLTADFAEAVRTMDLLVISSTVVALVLPLRSVVAGVGRPGMLILVGFVGLMLEVVLLLVLVPERFLGIETLGMKGQGAAIALLVTAVYYFFTLRYSAWRAGRILPNSRSYKHLLGAVVMVGVMYLFDWLFVPAYEWYGLISLAVVGTVAYSVTSYVMGELEASDYRYFRALLNPHAPIRYALNELLGKRV